MDILKLVNAFTGATTSELTVEVGVGARLFANGQMSSVAGAPMKSGEFEAQVIQRLDPFERERLRTTGRCNWQFEVEGLGRIVGEVEPGKAKLFLPVRPPGAPLAYPTVGSILRGFFVRK